MADLEEFPVDTNTHLRYRHVDQIGHGSTGYVEEVEEPSTSLVYARKRITVDSQSSCHRIQQVFANEVRTIRSLDEHPHFVRVIAVYATERHYNLVLEPKADDGGLARLSDRMPLSRSRKLEKGPTKLDDYIRKSKVIKFL